MAFGNPITDGNQVAVGTYGFVVAFDLSNQDPSDVVMVQVQKDGTTLYTPVTTKTEKQDLFNLPEQASNTVDYAFAQDGLTVYAFFRTATFTFVVTVRIAFWYYKNPTLIVTTSDYLEMPPEAKDLAKSLILQEVFELKGKQIPRQVLDDIATERERLGI